MLVIPRGLDVIGETRDGAGGPCPDARLSTSRTVVKVVVNQGGWLGLVHTGFGQGDQAARASVNDVVGKDIFRHVPLHLELAGAGRGRVVLIERVVDHPGMLGPAAVGGVASDGNACGVAVIDQIIAGGDVAGGSVLVLTGQLNPEIHI